MASSLAVFHGAKDLWVFTLHLRNTTQPTKGGNKHSQLFSHFQTTLQGLQTIKGTSSQTELGGIGPYQNDIWLSSYLLQRLTNHGSLFQPTIKKIFFQKKKNPSFLLKQWSHWQLVPFLSETINTWRLTATKPTFLPLSSPGLINPISLHCLQRTCFPKLLISSVSVSTPKTPVLFPPPLDSSFRDISLSLIWPGHT